MYWRLADEPEFRKKTRGTTVMLSGFICQCHGVISAETIASLSAAEKQSIKNLYKIESEKDPDFKPELPEHGAFSIILPGAGKGKDGYWGGEDVAAQLRHVIPIFKVMHPRSNLRFIFDNSSTHDCWSPDALNVEALVGGSTSNKNWVPMRPGFFKDTAGNTVAQDMQYPSPVFNCSLDSSQTPLLPNVLQELMDLRGRSKGITKPLEERNLMPAPATLALDTLTTAPSELATCQVIMKQGQRKGQVCSVRLPCRSHKAVPAAALATTALGVSATVSSTAMVDLPPATLMEVDAGSAPVVVAAISTSTLAAPINAAEDVDLHDLGDSILSGKCEAKIKQGARKGQSCGQRLPCRLHNPDLFKVRCDLCTLSIADDPDRRNRTNCCQRMLLSSQEDFKGQECMLAEICNNFSTVGQRVEAIFLPKFHCELNCIEFLWGFMKRRVRSQVTGTISVQDFLRIIKEALVACPVVMIRRWYRRMWKLTHLYEVGLPITVAKYICKKYSSHRTIPAVLMANIDNIKVLQDCKSTKTAVFEALHLMEVKAGVKT